MRANPRRQSYLKTFGDVGGLAALGAIFCFIMFLAWSTTDKPAHTATIAPVSKLGTASLTIHKTMKNKPVADPMETSP